MSIFIRRWVGDNGDILFPLTDIQVSTLTDGTLISAKGRYYIPINEEVVPIVAGNPMGLLLTLTYSATP